MRIRTTLCSLFFILAISSPVIADEEFLPTPYTADQIRDAWQEGLRITNRTRTPKGEMVATTTVVKWSMENVTLSEQKLDAAGAPAGPPGTATAAWTELRDHARFPAATSSRERTKQKTAYGEAVGWLYTTRNAGAISTFFFADQYPGSPLHFDSTMDGKVLFEVDQIARQEPPRKE